MSNNLNQQMSVIDHERSIDSILVDMLNHMIPHAWTYCKKHGKFAL